MRLLFLLLFITSISYGQTLVPFGGTRTTDTAYAARSLRIDSVVRLVRYGSSDSNKVLGVDAGGKLVLRTKGTGGSGVTSITAGTGLTGGTITSTGSIGLDQSALSITRSQVSDFTSGTVTSASTAQQAGTAVYAVLWVERFMGYVLC
jgi:hypothetical protein